MQMLYCGPHFPFMLVTNHSKLAKQDTVECYSPTRLRAERVEQQLCFHTVKAMHLCYKSISDQQRIGC